MQKEEIHGRIVGVVKEIRYLNPDDPPQPVLYQPHAQKGWYFFTFVIKTRGDTQAVVPSLRRVFRDLDPDLPIGKSNRCRPWRTGCMSSAV